MRKVIITGTLGQDGANMCEYLLKAPDCKVYGMIRRSANPNFINCKEFLRHENFQLVYSPIISSILRPIPLSDVAGICPSIHLKRML